MKPQIRAHLVGLMCLWEPVLDGHAKMSRNAIKIKTKSSINKATKKYSISKWTNKTNPGLFDTKKEVVIIEWRILKQKDQFDQDHIDCFIMKLGLDAKICDNPWIAVDSFGFTSNKDFDFTLLFIEKANVIWMQIVIKSKIARRKLQAAIKYLLDLNKRNL